MSVLVDLQLREEGVQAVHLDGGGRDGRDQPAKEILCYMIVQLIKCDML